MSSWTPSASDLPKVSLSCLFEYIESIEYSIMFNVVSGFNTLLNGLEGDSSTLLLQCRSKPSQQRLIANRMLCVMQEGAADDQHENINDMAITCYLYVLGKSEFSDLEEYATKVLNMPRLFWSYKMAHKVLDHDDIRSKN